MVARYTVRKMNKPKPRHNPVGEYGVWDRTYNRWVLNAEFLRQSKANRIADVMNSS